MKDKLAVLKDRSSMVAVGALFFLLWCTGAN